MMIVLSITIIFMILITTINSSECFYTSSNNSSQKIECDYCLSQSDFKFGTYRVQNSGIYCLTEDIIFNPLPPSEDISSPNTDDPLSWFPQNNQSYPGCTSMTNGPFALGFFSVIDIETNNVIIDLNGYKISYHFQFYLQQRFGSIIEISNQPFLPSTNIYTSFGNNFIEVNNIIIRNGELGLTSHHGIHSNNATNITIENINIYDFEVAGIQLNGFYHAEIKNVNIGPSLQDVPLTAFFSNARYLILALRQLISGIFEYNLPMPVVPFSYSNHSLTLLQIENNLVQTMDIIFRYYVSRDSDDSTVDSDNIEDYYTTEEINTAMKLFQNDDNLPDGSAMYGILLNSYDVAINDFGSSDNNGKRQGANIKMKNISLHDMALKTKEVIGVNFAECHNMNFRPKPKVTEAPTPAPELSPAAAPAPPPTYSPTVESFMYFWNWWGDWYDSFYGPERYDPGWGRRRLQQQRRKNEYESISTGPFGGVMDITKMVPDDQVELIENYDGTQDLSVLDYIGNPLSDAQIALYIYGDYLRDGSDYSYTSFISYYLLLWAVREMQFPSECVTLIRNHDNMHQIKKGVIGVRMDGIEDAEIENVSISNLYNQADNLYDQQNDIFDTNVRGISIIDGDLSMFGYNIIDNLVSWYGMVSGVDVMDETSYVNYGENSTLLVMNLVSKSEISPESDSESLRKVYIIAGVISFVLLVCCIGICAYCIKIDDEEKDERRSSLSIYIARSIRKARSSISISIPRPSISISLPKRGSFSFGRSNAGYMGSTNPIENALDLERIRSGSVVECDNNGTVPNI